MGEASKRRDSQRRIARLMERNEELEEEVRRQRSIIDKLEELLKLRERRIEELVEEARS